jgi:hypothetical protein
MSGGFVFRFLPAVIVIALTCGLCSAQWSEPQRFPITHGNAIRGPWISNDNLRIYAAFSGYIFVSERESIGHQWSPFHTVGNNVNGASRQESPCESPSGDTLYFMAEGREPCYGSYDIYYTIRTDSGWFGPILNCGPNINSQWREWSVGISRDGSTLLIASDRIPGGTMNLYYCEKLPEGSWGSLINFGPNINTWDDEEHPSLSPNNRKLVFYRIGPRMGDVWMSEYIDGMWDVATNLPAPVNTLQYRECDPCFGPDGRTLYFLSNRDSLPVGLQLYSTEDTTAAAVTTRPQNLPMAPQPTLFGFVRDHQLQLTLIGENRTGKYSLKLYNVLGRLIQQATVELVHEKLALKGDISIQDLPSGTYLVNLDYHGKQISTRFFITN